MLMILVAIMCIGEFHPQYIQGFQPQPQGRCDQIVVGVLHIRDPLRQSSPAPIDDMGQVRRTMAAFALLASPASSPCRIRSRIASDRLT